MYEGVVPGEHPVGERVRGGGVRDQLPEQRPRPGVVLSGHRHNRHDLLLVTVDIVHPVDVLFLFVVVSEDTLEVSGEALQAVA